MTINPRVALVIAFCAAAFSSRVLEAQTCYGTPSRGGLSANYTRVSFGKSVGASGTLAGEHFAWTVGGRSVSYGPTTTGFGGDTRVAVALGAEHFRVCPALGLDYEQRDWTTKNGKVSTMQLAAGAGIGFGYEQSIGENVRIIPFANGRYQFSALKFDFSSSNSVSETTADTLSGVHVQYGLVAQFKSFYLGFMGERPLESGAASVARAFVGITFADRRKK